MVTERVAWGLLGAVLAGGACLALGLLRMDPDLGLAWGAVAILCALGSCVAVLIMWRPTPRAE